MAGSSWNSHEIDWAMSDWCGARDGKNQIESTIDKTIFQPSAKSCKIKLCSCENYVSCQSFESTSWYW